MISGNPAVVVQNMLREAPKPLNAVDVVLAPVGERSAVVQAMVFPPALQILV